MPINFKPAPQEEPEERPEGEPEGTTPVSPALGQLLQRLAEQGRGEAATELREQASAASARRGTGDEPTGEALDAAMKANPPSIDDLLRAAPTQMRADLRAKFAQMQAQFDEYSDVLAMVPSLARMRDSIDERVRLIDHIDEEREEASRDDDHGKNREGRHGPA